MNQQAKLNTKLKFKLITDKKLLKKAADSMKVVKSKANWFL